MDMSNPLHAVGLHQLVILHVVRWLFEATNRIPALKRAKQLRGSRTDIKTFQLANCINDKSHQTCPIRSRESCVSSVCMKYRARGTCEIAWWTDPSRLISYGVDQLPGMVVNPTGLSIPKKQKTSRHSKWVDQLPKKQFFGPGTYMLMYFLAVRINLHFATLRLQSVWC